MRNAKQLASARCRCGWKLGQNLSGDCAECNGAIAKIPVRRGRQYLDPSLSDDAFEKEKAPQKPKCQPSRSKEEQAEAKRLAANRKKEEWIRQKSDADVNVAKAGFFRATVLEKGHQHETLLHHDWFQIAIPRDGHCLMHCFVRILLDRNPDHDIKTVKQMREALAQYFDSTNNEIEIFDDGMTCTFSCESIDCIRSGKDPSGNCRYYGGIPECVAFSYRFSISLQVYAPESMALPFRCHGGGPTDHAPEAILLTFGWHGNRRIYAMDHWQRMVSVHTSVSVAECLAPNDCCTVTVEGDDFGVKDAKVVRSLQCDTFIPGGPGRLVYCYFLETHYSQPLGHFYPTQVQAVERVYVSDSPPGVAPGLESSASEDAGDDSGGSHDGDSGDGGNALSAEDPEDAPEDSSHSHDGDSGDGGNAPSAAVCGDDNAHKVSAPQPRPPARAPGRKPKDDDADTTVWCHATEVTFLRLVVAHNPFAKHSGKISEKWKEIALEMAQSTRLMGVNSVTASSEALRMKFRRLKDKLKNFRESGKSSRQSGLASVREKDKEKRALAEIMDECLNLQKDVEEIRQTKKETDDAAKKC
jgi:hypothetical protein